MSESERKFFVTSKGLKVFVQPVSVTKMELINAAVRSELRAAGRPVDPPTYTVELAGGGTEEFPHDETTLLVRPAETGIEDPAEAEAEAERRTKANRQAWAEHQKAAAEIQALQRDRMTRLLISGIDIEVPDDGWEQEQQALGIVVPTDAAARRYHYVTTEVLVTLGDFLKATEAITAMSYEGVVKEEDIAAAMDSFRRELPGQPPGRAEGEGAVEVLGDAGGPPRDEGLGDDASGLAGGELRGPGEHDGARPDVGPDGGAGGQGEPATERRRRHRKPAAGKAA